MQDLLAPVHTELLRHGFALVWPADDGRPAVTASYVVPERKSARPERWCSCDTKRGTCRHLKELSRLARRLADQGALETWQQWLARGVWGRLARLLFDGRPLPWREVQLGSREVNGATAVLVRTGDGEELCCCFDTSPARVRFLERLGAPGDGIDRAAVLDRLARLQTTPHEYLLNEHGERTVRQAWEESVWHRLAYHFEREHPGGSFHPAIDRASGAVTLTYEREGAPLVRLAIPRDSVAAALRLLHDAFPDQPDLAIDPLPLRSLFHVRQETEVDVEVRPVIRALQENGEERFYDAGELEKFRYGRLVFLPELGILAELEEPGRERQFRAPARLRLERAQIPSFLEDHREALESGELVVDRALREVRTLTHPDAVEVAADAIRRSWYWLSLHYRYGTERVSLAEILRAKARGQPYLETGAGWIDLDKVPLGGLDGRNAPEADDGDGDRLRLRPGELLRLRSEVDRPVEVGGAKRRASVLRRLLSLSPGAPYEPAQGMTSELRPYQRLGVDWLRFLFENELGGLLCDDMGLGKTHQAMALMLSLREQQRITEPFLVVCPTSVIPHWRDRIREHAPGLRALVHHGAQRRPVGELEDYDVLVTSYGILRNDVDELRAIRFALAVFDEVQQLKNRDTLTHRAAARLRARTRLGLTGTPIENSLDELKALFDCVLDGYLGTDAAFQERYGLAQSEELATDDAEERRDELRRLIAPFVLRRLKSAVLDELPEKFEDQRACILTPEQAELYRAAIAERGEGLVAHLQQSSEPPPYIHVFALLNLLKQICDHPALALGELDQAEGHASGKWDLFQELLAECLGSGHKVVVFSQYLGMITLMERHLRELGVGSVTLTGSSRERGAIVDRFNHDPDCRVFLGSLKAGGTGIDLVGGSIVIHYDRWWNAAREDQATDRVHRIGQRRAVQVFKLVTEGTLEEKIAAIIERKRRLMESVVQADDPSLAKLFTRDELIALLAPV